MLEIILNKKVKFKGKYYSANTTLEVDEEEFKILEKHSIINSVSPNKVDLISLNKEESEQQPEKKKRGRKPKEVITENVDAN